MDKWLELVITPNDFSKINRILSDLVKPYIDRLYKDKIHFSWHFFREPELRWRISSLDEKIESIKIELDTKLTELERIEPKIYLKHFFGNHGEPNSCYHGEQEFYGEVWDLCYKRWEAGSNLALMLCTSNTSKSIDFYTDRDMHLILNQLGYERPYDEALMHLEQASKYVKESIQENPLLDDISSELSTLISRFKNKESA